MINSNLTAASNALIADQPACKNYLAGNSPRAFALPNTSKGVLLEAHACNAESRFYGHEWWLRAILAKATIASKKTPVDRRAWLTR